MEEKVALQVVTPLLEFIQSAPPESVPARLRALFDPSGLEGDTLDVSIFFPFALPESCVLRFNGLPSSVSQAGRMFARLAIFLGKAPLTVQGYLRRLACLFGAAERRYGIWDYRQLDVRQLQAILNQSSMTASEKMKTCTAVKYLYRYMASFCGETAVEMDLAALETMRHRWQTLSAAVSAAGKTPDIDSDYFDTLEQELPLIAADVSLPLNDRLTAAFLLLDISVGLRPNEQLSVKTDSLVVRRTTNGHEASYLRYEVHKLSHGGRTQPMAECYMLPGAVTAFNILLKLREGVKGKELTKRLYILPGNLEVKYRDYRRAVDGLFLRRLRGLCSTRWEDVRQRIIKGKTYWIPTPTQYRVRLCSFLYSQGVPLHVIELGMSHLTEQMLAYYVRVRDKTFSVQHHRVDNVLLSRMDNDYALDASGHKGVELMALLPLSLSQFRVYGRRLEEVTRKGYDYEIDRYTKLCRNKLFTEIRPALSFLSRFIASEGEEALLRSYPSLRHIVSSIESINNEITEWEKSHMK